MGRHFKRIEAFTLDLELLTNKAVKDSLKAGLDVLVNKTTHDSSNAAAHWVIVPDGERPRSPWFTARDLRSNGRAKVRRVLRHRLFKKAENGVIGASGDSRSKSKPEIVAKVVAYVKERENRDIITQVVRGRKMAVKKFHFYNAIQQGKIGTTMVKEEVGSYVRKANLDMAHRHAVSASRTLLGEFIVARVRAAWQAARKGK